MIAELEKEFKEIWKCEHPDCGGGGICQRDRIWDVVESLLTKQKEKIKKELLNRSYRYARPYRGSISIIDLDDALKALE